MRVSREAVRETLKEWSVEEDDFLRGDAVLIWSSRAVDDHPGGFFNGGIPLNTFEVWEGGSWRHWDDALQAVPDKVRMIRQGWQPIVMTTRQGSALGYWTLVACSQAFQMKTHVGHWLVLVLDEDARGSLGGEARCVAAVAQDLFGSSASGHGWLAGVLTVHPTKEKLWTEQYTVSSMKADSGGWLSNWLCSQGIVPQRYVWEAHACSTLSQAQERALVEESRLRIAKPEFPDLIWRSVAL